MNYKTSINDLMLKKRGRKRQKSANKIITIHKDYGSNRYKNRRKYIPQPSETKLV